MARLRSIFGPAFDAARGVLRDLDADQVPNDLRDVVATSGDLPPHLERVLLKAIDRYEWLREGTAEAWPAADPDADGAAGASALLILRPPGWVMGVVSAATAESAEAAADRLEALQSARASALERLEEARRRLKASEAERERLEQEVSDHREAARQDRRADEAAMEQARRDGAEIASALRADLDQLREEVGALADSERHLGEEVRSLRRDRAELTRRLEVATTPSWAEDPVELARRIDELALMAAPAASLTGAPGAGDPPADLPPLPAGIRPDRGEAITWLLGLPAAATVLVDGYNVGNPLGDTPSAMRGAVELKAEALARGGRHRIVVVYDSAEGPDDDTVVSGAVPPPIDIRFTPPGVVADDVIAGLVADVSGPVVVITSDRELRERAEAGGALVLWSEAVREWSGR